MTFGSANRRATKYLRGCDEEAAGIQNITGTHSFPEYGSVRGGLSVPIILQQLLATLHSRLLVLAAAHSLRAADCVHWQQQRMGIARRESGRTALRGVPESAGMGVSH